MAEINLIPKGLAPKGGLNKVSKNIKAIDVIGTIVFLVIALTFLGLIFINSRKLKTITASQEKLKSSIKSMQQVEQQYTLVKDRLSIMKENNASGNLADDLEVFQKFFQQIPSGVTLESAELNDKVTEIQLAIPNSDLLSQTFRNAVTSDLYSKIVVSSFLLRQGSGYQVAIEATR